ncbi:GrpB family protein [bacterium]|nr:GrpB family protein [bacterium]
MKIEVVPYDPNWISIFELERQILLHALPSLIHEVYHIGSTSVKGLAAKPIIDILLVVSSLSELDSSNYVFEKLGYESMGEFGIKGRRYFRKGRLHRTHHIHAFRENDPNIVRHIAFRNYLESRAEIRIEYANLKAVLAKTCNNDSERYCAGKDGFIKYHEAKALRLFEQAHNNRPHEHTQPRNRAAERP